MKNRRLKLIFSSLISLVLVIGCFWFQTAGSAANPPRGVVTEFYQWYVQNQDQARDRFAQQKAKFDPQFYQQLVQAFQKNPQDGAWLDFDPFSNTQVSTFRAVVRASKQYQESAEVDVDVYAGLSSTRSTAIPIKVLLVNQNNQWRISNFVYMQTWDNLRCWLREINRTSCQ